jgi:hypothetical protein
VRDFNADVAQRSEQGLADMRDACERALSAGGLHVTQGARLWDVYIG